MTDGTLPINIQVSAHIHANGAEFAWQAIEVNGVLNYDGIKCEFSKKGRLSSIKRDCGPYDWLERECDFNENFIDVRDQVFQVDPN